MLVKVVALETSMMRRGPVGGVLDWMLRLIREAPMSSFRRAEGQPSQAVLVPVRRRTTRADWKSAAPLFPEVIP